MDNLTSKMAALVNGGHANHPETTITPPGAPGKPYIISSQDGEIIYIPLSKSATRLLVTGAETDNAFAIVGSGGSQSDPIGFHYHRAAHDIFLCLRGHINVWADAQCRTLGAGDFASVPPGTVHQYQILGPHSEMMGLIVPGGWEEFFRFIGEPYQGPMWPMQDERDFFETLLPRLKRAAEKFDMVPCPQKESFGPQEWSGAENVLPGKLEPYFLKSGTGPAYEVGGTVCRPVCTTKESGGRFSLGSIESSKLFHAMGIFAKAGQTVRFDKVHHAFYVDMGSVTFHLDGTAPTKLSVGEMLYVPKGTAFRFETVSRFSRLYAFASGDGLVEVLCRLGREHTTSVLPETAEKCDVGALEALGPECAFTVW
ncbi:cupin domain-containing protein [Hortaea werneckii]|nr:cupin domain-containing protein [Hortaea werneckii]